MAIKQEYTKEDLIDLSYEEFVSHLLKYAVLKNVYNKLNSEEVYFNELLELFYELDDYSQFDNSLLKDHIELITYERVQKIFLHYGKKLKAENINTKNSIKENQKEISQKVKNIQIEDLSEPVLLGFSQYIQNQQEQNQSRGLANFKIQMTAKLCQQLYQAGYVRYIQITAIKK